MISVKSLILENPCFNQNSADKAGHQFFDLRELWAINHHFSINAFCSLIRPDAHPAQPKNFRTHDSFWMMRGYQRHNELIAKLDWLEIHNLDIMPVISHNLVFWLKC